MPKTTKTPNPNIRETTLHLSVFYDQAITDPDKLAAFLDEVLHGGLARSRLESFGHPHINSLHCPVAEVVEPSKSNLASRAAYNASTIDEAIEALAKAKELSNLGGKACLYVSLTGSEIEPMPVEAFAVVNDETGGAVLEVRAVLPDDVLLRDNPLGMDSSELEDQAEQIRKFSPPEDEDDGG